MIGYPTPAERLAIAHSGGRNGSQPRFPPPDEPRAIIAALQAIYEAARGNANGARNYAKFAVRLARYAEFPNVQRALDGAIVVNVGQLSHAEELAFARAVRRGELLKWRGKWYPQEGAEYGMGPDKTCWSAWNPYKQEGAPR